MSAPGINMTVRGSLAITIGASAWGLFWLPMRYFDEAGLGALWAVAAINFAACFIAIPVAIWRGEVMRQNLPWLAIIGIGMGVSNVLYFAGLILSDVIRVTFLFYLLPIWATLFSRVFYKVLIGPAKAVAVFFAFCGIWFLLGGGGWPIPQNLGDVFGLFSGMGWAFGLTAIRGRGNLGGFATTAASNLFALVTALLLGSILVVAAPAIQPPLPPLGEVAHLILPVFAFSVLVMWPTNVGQLWGARFVAATTAALLTMSEILMATVSSTLIEGSQLSGIAWLGAGFILVAILIDMAASARASHA